jgi:hypothetical protein
MLEAFVPDRTQLAMTPHARTKAASTKLARGFVVMIPIPAVVF